MRSIRHGPVDSRPLRSARAISLTAGTPWQRSGRAIGSKAVCWKQARIDHRQQPSGGDGQRKLFAALADTLVPYYYIPVAWSTNEVC